MIVLADFNTFDFFLILLFARSLITLLKTMRLGRLVFSGNVNAPIGQG